MRDFIFTFNPAASGRIYCEILAGAAGRIHPAQIHPGQNHAGHIDSGRIYFEETHAN